MLSNVKRFIISRSGGGLTSFNKNILVNFSSEKSKMKPAGVYFFGICSKNFKSNLVLVIIHVWNVYVEFYPVSPLAQNKEHHAESWKINVEKKCSPKKQDKVICTRSNKQWSFLQWFSYFCTWCWLDFWTCNTDQIVHVNKWKRTQVWTKWQTGVTFIMGPLGFSGLSL